MVISTAPTGSPYVGPRPFERGDSAQFFGRDQETAELLALIIAHRIVVLYAPSGAGKTSLLNAQIVPQLEARGFEVLPPARVQGAVQALLAEEVNPYVFFAMLGWAGGEEPQLSTLTIAGYLAQQEPLEDIYGQPAPRVLIFDQFEELFTAFPTRWVERGAFFDQIGEALTADPALRIIFSLREDYIAQLDPYASRMPDHLRYRFRLERMRPPAALAAITGPLRDTPCSFAPGVAENLVRELQQTRVESPGGITTATGEFIEPVQLQVVCQNLWQALPADVNTITQTDVEAYGDVNQALAHFYENTLQQTKRVTRVGEARLRDWFETQLITPAQTRGIVFQDQEKGETGGLPNEAVRELDRLHIIRGEVRAGSRWVELTHDRFIEPILKANEDWHQRRRARLLRLGFGVTAFLALAALLLLFTTFFSAQAGGVPADAYRTATAGAATQIVANQVSTLDAATRNALAAEATRGAETAVAATATQAGNNQTATATAAIANANDTATAVAIATAAVQATQNAQVTATAVAATEIARATIDAQATLTAEELARRSQPIRPLRPGISIGAEGSGSAGTLSGFVRTGQGELYLLALNALLGDSSTPILQPGPIDGGRPENGVAVGLASAGSGLGTSVVAAAGLVGLARLQPDVTLEVTIPDVGPVLGVRSPVAGTTVIIVGRTSGIIRGQISPDPPAAAYDARLLRSAGLTRVAGAVPLVDVALSAGDEGALVLDQAQYAVGIVLAVEPVPLIAPLPDVLASLNAELLYVGQEVATLSGPRRELEAVEFSADGRWLAGSSKDTDTFLWAVTSTVPFPPVLLAAHTFGIWDLAFSQDSRYLVTGGINGQVYLWDLAAEDRADTGLRLQGLVNDIIDVDFSSDSRRVAAAGASSNVYVWDLRQRDAAGQPALTILTGQEGFVNTLLFSPDSRWLGAASQSGVVGLWDLSDPAAALGPLVAHTGSVITLAFSPDSELLATAGADTIVRIWDLATAPPQILHELRGHTGPVTTMAFAPDSRWLATSGRDNSIRLWHLDDLSDYRLDGHTEWVRKVAFTPDGRWLVSGSNDSTARLWDLATGVPGERFISLTAHAAAVRQLAFTPDGRWLATGSDDRTIKLWRIR